MKNKNKLIPIIIIAIVAIGLVIGIMVKRNVDNGASNTEEVVDEVNSDTQVVENVFSGHHFIAQDTSVIYFEEDGTYKWYKDDSDHEDNYYLGTYEIYNAEVAEDYLVNDLTEYGVTQEKLDSYFERNSEEEVYTLENLYCITLHNEVLVLEGAENELDQDQNYMGFYKDNFYDGANLRTGNRAQFQLIE